MRGRFAAGGIFLPAALWAQQLTPACVGPEHRQFDFWVGDWTVTDSAGTVRYGANVITLVEAGCAVREQWTSVRGGTGQSLNFYDPRRRQWEQLWVASDGTVLRLAGGMVRASMVLEGDVQTRTGTTTRNRISWTPQPDGRVRQYWTVSTDGGRTWRVEFDGWYRRQSPPPAQ